MVAAWDLGRFGELEQFVRRELGIAGGGLLTDGFDLFWSHGRGFISPALADVSDDASDVFIVVQEGSTAKTGHLQIPSLIFDFDRADQAVQGNADNAVGGTKDPFGANQGRGLQN